MSDWQDLLREASRLRTLGRVDEAIASYERLLAAKPDLADSWYNLGWLQRKARRFDDALQSYQQALDLSIREPVEVRVTRAVTGREKILVFNGCYHGSVDETMVRLVGGKAVNRPGLAGAMVASIPP